MKRKTHGEWIKIFEEAANAPTSQRQWCRDHDIDIGVYFTTKNRYKKLGLLPELGTSAVPVAETENCVSFQDGQQNRLLHIYPRTVQSVAMDTLLSIIRCIMNMDVYGGDRYLFLSKDRKTVYMLRWTGAGFCLAKARKEKGLIGWPGKGMVFSEEMLEEIRKMTG